MERTDDRLQLVSNRQRVQIKNLPCYKAANSEERQWMRSRTMTEPYFRSLENRIAEATTF